ncbi:MAG: inner membrane-spanning protein YciB [Methylacidiphilales bacterium]|nr:inner membrane-spanning protein YciB [Candidatus Methylacidiphilales bacterium]
MANTLVEFLPLVLFFVAYKIKGVYIATIVLMLSMVLACLYYKIRTNQCPKMLSYSTLFVVVAGVFTLLFDDPIFLQIKPTVLYLSFAGAMYGMLKFRKKNILQALLSNKINLTKNQWDSVLIHWVFFFLFLGEINIIIAYFFSFDFWVGFKVFGMIILNIFFLVFEGIWLYTKGATISSK